MPPIRGTRIGPFVVHLAPKQWRLAQPDRLWRVTHRESGCLAAWDPNEGWALKKARRLVELGRKYGVKWRGRTDKEFLAGVEPDVVSKLRAAVRA